MPRPTPVLRAGPRPRPRCSRPASRPGPDSSDSDYDASPRPEASVLPRRAPQRLGAGTAPRSTLILSTPGPSCSSPPLRKQRRAHSGRLQASAPACSRNPVESVRPSTRPPPRQTPSRSLSSARVRLVVDAEPADDDLDILPSTRQTRGLAAQVCGHVPCAAPSPPQARSASFSEDGPGRSTEKHSKRLQTPAHASRKPCTLSPDAASASQSQADMRSEGRPRPPTPARLKLPSFRSIKSRRLAEPDPAFSGTTLTLDDDPSSDPCPSGPPLASVPRRAVQLITLGPSRAARASSYTPNRIDLLGRDTSEPPPPLTENVASPAARVTSGRPILKKIPLTGKTKAHLDEVQKQQEHCEYAQEELGDHAVGTDALGVASSRAACASVPAAPADRAMLNAQILAMANAAGAERQDTSNVPTRVEDLDQCPFCSKPLPERMTKALRDMLQLLVDEYHRSHGHVGGQQTVGVCLRHDDERVTVPRGIEQSWPTTFSADQMRRRVRCAAPGSKSSDGRSAHWHRLAAVIARPEDSIWYTCILQRIKVHGQRAFSTAAQMDSAAEQRAGYYGEKGWETLLTMCLLEFISSLVPDGARSQSRSPLPHDRGVLDLAVTSSPPKRACTSPTLTIDPDRISPVTSTVFVHSVLMPELITSLLQEDLRRAGRPADVAAAIRLRDESTRYGLALFPADDRMAIDAEVIRRLLQGKSEEAIIDLSGSSRPDSSQ